MQERERVPTDAAVIPLLTIFAFLVHGYHPFVEDGGVYGAGIRKLLNPSLYPGDAGFVTQHLKFSVFAPLVAALVRLLHVRLEVVLLALYLLSLGLTLYAGWMLICRLTSESAERFGALALQACWLTIPVAGTSLMLVDPYLTARSFSTPLVMIAIACALDAALERRPRSALSCAFALGSAGILHPLMAGYGCGAVLMVFCFATRKRKSRFYAVVALLLGTVAVGWLLQAFAPPEAHDYLQVALTRSYWFPLLWHWYELLGLIAPLCVIWWLGRGRHGAGGLIARSGVMFGALGLVVALVFGHPGFRSHLVARMQPLRTFQIVYLLMILMLGAWLGKHVLRRIPWRWAAMLAVFGGVMCFAQRETFAHSRHIEWPGLDSENPWAEAFVWVSAHTPIDALFAMDAHYVTQGSHEDAQCFRAIAQRSVLPDYSKDGGVAAIAPQLTPAWIIGQEAQQDLESESDARRLLKLQPLGVSWVILEVGSRTAWSCPYSNSTVKVCRFP